jgi:predicted phosphodiesterase
VSALAASSKQTGVVRVQVLSDLHGEMAPERLPSPSDLDTGADLVVLAGDVARAPDSVAVAARLFRSAEAVVMVGGNHEHYRTGAGIDAGLAAMSAEAARLTAIGGPTFIVLEDEETVIPVRGVRVRIVGCTLWTDFGLFGEPARDAVSVARGLNDYRCILGTDGSLLTAHETACRHAASRAFLGRVLATAHDGPTIVVTHHLPSMRSVAQRYRHDRISAGFASRADELVSAGAALWVHGHTHDSFAWRDDAGTLVVCNPAGYPVLRNGRENPAFYPRLVVDVRRGGPTGAWRAGVESRPRVARAT